jgi:hypothetical protein
MRGSLLLLIVLLQSLTPIVLLAETIHHAQCIRFHSLQIKFFRQLGEWTVHDQCVDKTVGDAMKGSTNSFGYTCCLPEPAVTCFYRDKPSKIPCKDSPPIDKNGRSFW